MSIHKYFWGLNPKALRGTPKILKDPEHPLFVERAYTMLSRCDAPRELFRVMPKKIFVSGWPQIRRHWVRMGQQEDFRAWWETIYEQLLGDEKFRGKHGSPAPSLISIGQQIRTERIKLGWNQSDLARRARVQQPDVSAIEKGRKNVTLETLLRICKVTGIQNIKLFPE